jgi:hypothetical protein
MFVTFTVTSARLMRVCPSYWRERLRDASYVRDVADHLLSRG